MAYGRIDLPRSLSLEMTNPSVRTPNMGTVWLYCSGHTWRSRVIYTQTHTHTWHQVIHMVHDYTHGTRIHKWSHGWRTWNKVNTNGLLVTVQYAYCTRYHDKHMGYGTWLCTYDRSKVTNMILGYTMGTGDMYRAPWYRDIIVRDTDLHKFTVLFD